MLDKRFAATVPAGAVVEVWSCPGRAFDVDVAVMFDGHNQNVLPGGDPGHDDAARLGLKPEARIQFDVRPRPMPFSLMPLSGSSLIARL